MTGEDLLAAGAAALADGRWQAARSAFEAATAQCDDPRAVDGLGEALWWLGEPARGMELRERAYVEFRRRGQHDAALAAALGVAITQASNFGNLDAAGGWVSRAEHLAGDDEPTRSWVSMTRAYVSSDPYLAVRLYRESLAAARRRGDVDLELCSLAGLGEKLVLTGRVGEGLALVDECMAGTFAGEPTRLDTIAYTTCDMLSACDLAFDLARARRWCATADRFVGQYGCPFLFARCRMVYGSLLISDGQWDAGEAELTVAREMSRGAGPVVAADAAARLADLRLRQGRFEEADRLLRGHTSEPATYPVRAALAVRCGNPTTALALAERSARPPLTIGSGTAMMAGVQARIALGDLDEARQTADGFGLDGRHPLWAAFRAMACSVVALATPGADARAVANEAAAAFAVLGLPYESAQARLLVARAEVGPRPERAVVEAQEAWLVFRRLGATGDVDEAAALLRALGSIPPAGQRSSTVLTRREDQVLDLLRAGLTNPEIAARLHISRKTTAHHVSRVLTKLGLRNRAEAAAWRAERDGAERDGAAPTSAAGV